MGESNPLVERVDALLRRHQQQAAEQPPVPAQAGPDLPPSMPDPAPVPVPMPEPQLAGADDDIPVLTEIVDPPTASSADGRAFVEGIEAVVLEKLLLELDRSLEMRLNRTIGEVVEQVMDGLRADLSDRVRLLVREAVAASLANEVAGRSRTR